MEDVAAAKSVDAVMPQFSTPQATFRKACISSSVGRWRSALALPSEGSGLG
jgi:hypothetical protein